MKLYEVMKRIEKVKTIPMEESDVQTFRDVVMNEIRYNNFARKLVSTETWKKIAETVLFQIKSNGSKINEENYTKLLRIYHQIEIVLKIRGCPKPTARDLFKRFKVKKIF